MHPQQDSQKDKQPDVTARLPACNENGESSEVVTYDERMANATTRIPIVAPRRCLVNPP